MSRATVELPGGELIVLDDARWAAIESAMPRNNEPVRAVYAAAHVVMRDSYAGVSHAPDSPGAPGEIIDHIDWDATMAFRRHLSSHDFGIAEAMDTAQRFELGWAGAKQLIERCGELDLPHGFIAGAGTDQLERIDSKRDLIDGVLHQCRFIHERGGIPIVLAQPWLTQQRANEEDYVEVYGAIIRNAPCEILIHWLGPMFLPALDGYFPGDSFERIMRIDPSVCRGAKLSMLDAELEVRLRRSMVEREQMMFTGDDYHFGALLRGAPPRQETTFAGRRIALGDFSHGLLGIFDAIAAPASIALRALAAGRLDDYDDIMRPCEALGQTIFEPPTSSYKVGLAFIAWLNGLQQNPTLINHFEKSRPPDHLLAVVRRANEAGAILDARIAAERLRLWMERA